MGPVRGCGMRVHASHQSRRALEPVWYAGQKCFNFLITSCSEPMQRIEQFAAEYAEEASFLWLQRAHAVHAPNYSPRQFADLDERVEANMDGLRVAGVEGWRLAEAALENEGPEDFFPAAVLALEAQDGRFDAVIERARRLPEV